MKTIVISGINFFEGGPLSVYKDCLDNIVKSGLNETNNVIAFVHKKEIFTEYNDKITIIELPKSKKNYFFRIWYEYVYFYFFSRGKDIDVWISLHDMTPNVRAKKRYVYCHNASPFMETSIKNLKYSYKNFLFSLFYKYLYRINIKKNTAVIVQQDWMRNEFVKMYNLENVIVARPTLTLEETFTINVSKRQKENFQFIYPAFPRFFKNFEVICKACEILELNGVEGYEVLLTIDGTENSYSKDLKTWYGKISTIKFIGLQERKKLFDLYGTVDCMIFPSKLETWGLPISEFKATCKYIMLANLPYAHETVGTYDKAVFFNHNKPEELADFMEKAISGRLTCDRVVEDCVKEPYAENWKILLDMICAEN